MDFIQSKLKCLEDLRLTESQCAYGSTLLISIAPFLLLFLFKVENTAQHRNKLRLALSFASGGLLGDAFLHLIPHSMGHDHGHNDHYHNHEKQHNESHHHPHPHDDHYKERINHKHPHSHQEQSIIGLCIIIGIILFFLIEKFVHLIKDNSHLHHHSHQHNLKNKKEKISDSEPDDQQKPEKSKRTKLQRKIKTTNSPKRGQYNSDISQTRLVSGILNLIADFLHNFTDGLAIGATFAAGQGMGAITAMTILVHEIPHEIGDYAILIQAGYRRHNALLLQLVTAIGALIGTSVGLYYGTLDHATQFILPITAGGFIYIATVSVMPELLEKTSSYMQSIYEIILLFIGVAMMYSIALNE